MSIVLNKEVMLTFSDFTMLGESQLSFISSVFSPLSDSVTFTDFHCEAKLSY